MTETVRLRLDVVASGDVDWALCSLPDVRLVHCDGAAFLECAPEITAAARTLLARAGVRAVTVASPTPRPMSLLPACISDLAPIDRTGTIDTLAVRVLTVGDAARPTDHGLFRRRPPEASRLRTVLHGDDRMFAWRRIIWADRATLRSRVLAHARPIVFDNDAITHGQERRAFARDGALARWIGQ